MNTEIINNETYNMKSDIIFKEVFSKPGNEDILIDFLEGILDLKITKLEVLKDVSLMKEVAENKYGVLDLRATLDDNTLVIIEMQVKKYEYMPYRLTYYSGSFYSNQLKAGENYTKLKNVISICICDYSFLSNDEYVTPFELIETIHRKYILKNGQKFVFVELPKFRKYEQKGLINIDDKLTQWLLFIDGKSTKGVEIAMEKNKYIKKANETRDYLFGDEEFRRIIALRKKSELDYNSSMEESLQKGIEQGIEQGSHEGKIQIAKEMLKDGFSIEKISKITKLDISEIGKIKMSM